MATKLANRFAVEMHGNAPVVYDRECSRVVKWFKDVLHTPRSREFATSFAKEMNAGERCETCGEKLQAGHLPGNHVRGEKDERCDACFGRTL